MIVDVSRYGSSILKEGENLSSFCLGIIRVGNDLGCLRYQRAIEREAHNFHLTLEIFERDNIEEQAILSQISKWNQDNKINGIILLHPIPRSLNEEKLKKHILPEKDVDGLASSLYLPTTVEAILLVLKNLDLIRRDKRFAIIGRSSVLGKPLYEALKRREKVTLFHRQHPPENLSCYDCIINATGDSSVIENKHIRKESILLTLNTGKEASSFEGIQVTTASGLGYLSALFLFQHLLIKNSVSSN